MFRASVSPPGHWHSEPSQAKRVALCCLCVRLAPTAAAAAGAAAVGRCVEGPSPTSHPQPPKETLPTRSKDSPLPQPAKHPKLNSILSAPQLG